MLEQDRIDISEGVDFNKTNLSKECELCHYWYFKDIGFKYEPYLCNGCQDLMQKAMSFNNVAVVCVKGSAYGIKFWYMCKNDAINIINGSNLTDKRSVLSIFSLYKKMSESAYLTYCRRNREVILNRAKDYYENDKQRLREQARDKYRDLFEEEKNKEREYGKNRCRNISEEKKKRLKEYKKTYREAKKFQYNNE